MLYGAETWTEKKVQEKKLDVAEMTMLRWICALCGVTKLNRIRRDKIRTTKVIEILKCRNDLGQSCRQEMRIE